MRIRRFNEADVKRIAEDRLGEMIEQLSDFVAQMKDRQASTDALINELIEYQVPSKKDEDQIDVTVSALRVVKKAIDETIDKLDNAVGSLESYSDEDRQYLFDEDKS